MAGAWEGPESEESVAATARPLVLTWLALLALSALTLGLSFVALGPFEMTVALIVATTKAVLVVLFFMHILTASWTAKIVVIVTALMLIVLLFFMPADVATRDVPPMLPPS